MFKDGFGLNMLSLNTYRSLRCFSITTVCLRNHYDSLGVTLNATQADIKEAYYKLSMLYHPDKTANSDSSVQKFRDITEAYEVLGNVRLRKLYDKGVSPGIASTDVADKFHKSREKRSRPPSTGRSPIYDFDEWSRQHYTATVMEDRERKRKYNMHQSAAAHQQHNIEMGKVILLMAIVFGFMVYQSTANRELDRPKLKRVNGNQLDGSNK